MFRWRYPPPCHAGLKAQVVGPVSSAHLQPIYPRSCPAAPCMVFRGVPSPRKQAGYGRGGNPAEFRLFKGHGGSGLFRERCNSRALSWLKSHCVSPVPPLPPRPSVSLRLCLPLPLSLPLSPSPCLPLSLSLSLPLSLPLPLTPSPSVSLCLSLRPSPSPSLYLALSLYLSLFI